VADARVRLMGAAGERADFTRMSERALLDQLHISAVLQKAVVTVDEEGTEAAAVTVVEGGTFGFDPDAPFVFRADRPFLFVIRERASGTILFAGVFTEPPDSA